MSVHSIIIKLFFVLYHQLKDVDNEYLTLFLRDGHDGVAEVDLREVQQVAVPSNKSTSDQVIGWGQ